MAETWIRTADPCPRLTRIGLDSLCRQTWQCLRAPLGMDAFTVAQYECGLCSAAALTFASLKRGDEDIRAMTLRWVGLPIGCRASQKCRYRGTWS